ncbi:MAG TPA: hypothetical protein VMD05_05750, partial [Candidatus Nanoarchaeia archaeon]|nr:hypothetical protein [Candidatus Nanoarchaeia archaeon]
TAIDPNNNIETIATVTSDATGLFSYMFTPPVPGTYTIVATFGGSNSYYGSYAETAIGVSPAASSSVTTPAPVVTPTGAATAAPTPTPTIAPTPSPVTSPSSAPQPSSGIPASTYIAIAAAVVIIVVIAAAIALRRRK